MFRMFPIAAVFALLLLPAAALADYSKVITDLPLMQTMTEDLSKMVAFDTPDGRILETTAETPAPFRQVLGYYNHVLPPLGWQLQKGSYNVYRRKNEMLVIDVFSKQDEKGIQQVQFKIAPALK
ncbi:MAG: hypothetical protein Q8K65_02910 [Alphaproteobacteria bacterium]|nr:hypothetical protein [Alphaproteobacteria bacterium]